MNNIVKFPASINDDSFCYMDLDGDLGLSTVDRKIAVLRLNDDEFTVITPEGEELHNRRQLAEFFWAAATFIDSDEKWRIDGKMVACNYE